MDAVHGEMLKPFLGAFRKVKWQVLDDEEVVVCPACSKGEAKVFQPHGGVGVPVVLDNVRRCMKVHREWCLPDPFCEHLRAVGV